MERKTFFILALLVIALLSWAGIDSYNHLMKHSIPFAIPKTLFVLALIIWGWELIFTYPGEAHRQYGFGGLLFVSGGYIFIIVILTSWILAGYDIPYVPDLSSTPPATRQSLPTATPSPTIQPTRTPEPIEYMVIFSNQHPISAEALASFAKSVGCPTGDYITVIDDSAVNGGGEKHFCP